MKKPVKSVLDTELARDLKRLSWAVMRRRSRMSQVYRKRTRRMPAIKVCPMILRTGPGGRRQILAFLHPKAGKQIIKGTVEPTESIRNAALRELKEESGISNAEVIGVLGSFEVFEPHQVWHAVLCKAESLPDKWVFHTLDDGGHDFEFFWHYLDSTVDEQWHSIFRQALNHISEMVLGSGVID